MFIFLCIKKIAICMYIIYFWISILLILELFSIYFPGDWWLTKQLFCLTRILFLIKLHFPSHHLAKHTLPHTAMHVYDYWCVPPILGIFLFSKNAIISCNNIRKNNKEVCLWRVHVLILCFFFPFMSTIIMFCDTQKHN